MNYCAVTCIHIAPLLLLNAHFFFSWCDCLSNGDGELMNRGERRSWRRENASYCCLMNTRWTWKYFCQIIGLNRTRPPGSVIQTHDHPFTVPTLPPYMPADKLLPCDLCSTKRSLQITDLDFALCFFGSCMHLLLYFKWWRVTDQSLSSPVAFNSHSVIN